MDDEKRAHLLSFLKVIPPVDFCCVYGSVLHTTNHDKSTMVDYILGVSDPLQWHSENLKMNADHYASWMVLLGGAKLVTEVADKIGVGVHFNPFVTWNNKMFKYGVVRMHDLVQDILNWERLYLSGRLQKPVNMLVDNLDIKDVNSVNLRAAVSAALLLLPPKFTEVCFLAIRPLRITIFVISFVFMQEDLYAKICSLSYMGDLRMFFAEDRNKVKKIVQGQFDLFQSMYKPFLEEYEGKDLLRFSSSENQHANIYQALHEVVIGSREEATKRMQKVLRRTVMVSSARQAVSGLLTVGGVKAARYLTNKMQKAWRSWT
ncbi:phosphatidate cytidylyltransferase, mitochondrial isoform X4 [Durio zibethinus]|uniref:Phosphatidate cytidylyltransferase, mitochondrial n=1 Tax=Durio zibethinus TaxID=66656 RepID=A0A6P5Z7M8_DURZI|nr:phosphatidate cytidylyltransferase, mitochondrial isoform X4 [Durio zibethinus]